MPNNLPFSVKHGSKVVIVDKLGEYIIIDKLGKHLIVDKQDEYMYIIVNTWVSILPFINRVSILSLIN